MNMHNKILIVIISMIFVMTGCNSSNNGNVTDWNNDYTDEYSDNTESDDTELDNSIDKFISEYIENEYKGSELTDEQLSRMKKIAYLFSDDDDRILECYRYNDGAIDNYTLDIELLDSRIEKALDDITLDDIKKIAHGNYGVLSPRSVYSYGLFDGGLLLGHKTLQNKGRSEHKGSGDYMVAKPVIYIYNKENTCTDDINVKLIETDTEKLQFTYPEYDKEHGWIVRANQYSKITNLKDNATYDYLFYEANTDYMPEFDEGFIVKSEDAIDFLEEKLDYLGLSQSEKTEFIAYWGPILSNSEYNIVKFGFDSELKLEITPEPDNLYRLFIYIKPVDNPINLDTQDLASNRLTNRDGFTVVEWGGTYYN